MTDTRDPAAGPRTIRQQHEAEVYDDRAAGLLTTLRDDELRVDPAVPPFPNREHVQFLSFLLDRLGPPANRRILEVGTGSGTLAIWLAMQGAHVTGLDVSNGMLQIARRRAAVNGVSERVELVAQPVEDLDLRPGSFDVVLGNQVLHHLDLPRAMPSVRRILTVEGMALFAEPVLMVPEWLRQARYHPYVTRRFPSRADTPDERSLDLNDVRLVRAAFASSELHSFQALARIQNFHELSDGSFARLERLDQTILRRVPATRRLARFVVLVLRNRVGSDPGTATAARAENATGNSRSTTEGIGLA